VVVGNPVLMGIQEPLLSLVVIFRLTRVLLSPISFVFGVLIMIVTTTHKCYVPILELLLVGTGSLIVGEVTIHRTLFGVIGETIGIQPMLPKL